MTSSRRKSAATATPPRRPRRRRRGVRLPTKLKGDPAAEAKIVEFLKTGGTEDHKKVVASDADLKAIAQIVLSSK